MNNSQDISEVSTRLELAYARSKTDSMTPQEQYELYECIAIQILDSEFCDYPDGELEACLMRFLQRKRQALL